MKKKFSWRGRWGENNGTFGRCNFCNNFSIRGICQTCGHVSVCASCKRVRLPDRTWEHVPHNELEASHGFCEECAKSIYPVIYAKIQIKHQLASACSCAG